MTAMRRRRGARRSEIGQASLLIIGFASVLVLMVAVVVDVSAAHLQRQALNNLAEGAALAGADQGALGADSVASGSRLAVDEMAAEAAVSHYLTAVKAHQQFPGLTHQVAVSAEGRVLVTVRAPAELPIPVPGAPARAVVGTSAGAGVTVVR